MLYFDTKFISYAINLTKKHEGLTAPNPAVACVITIDNEIISSSVTAISGRPHAEQIAIAKVENKTILQEATIYITLEPCAHFGQTPPCVDEIIKHKFKRVVIATKDHDSRVNGLGIAKLQKAGIPVTYGICEEKANEIYRAFFKSRTQNIPYVTLKIVSSLDGKIATKNFDSKWISSAKTRKFTNYLRANYDGILIGNNTLKNDDPGLDCRIAGMENFSPKKILLSNSFNHDFNFRFFQTKNIILCSKAPNIILPDSSEIILCQEKNNRVKLKDALQKLCLHGINSLLIEGGKNVATQFLQENLVDEIIWIRNNKIIGNDGLPAIGEMNYNFLSEIKNNFIRKEFREFDEDLVEILVRH